DASALIYLPGKVPISSMEPQRCTPDQLVGICADRKNLPEVVPHALEKGFDILLLDTTRDISAPWVELGGDFDLTVIRDAILRLRSMNMEEEISLINFGGVRSGTDVAKSLAMNCRASIPSVAMALAMGGRMDTRGMDFNGLAPVGSTVENPGSNGPSLFDAAVNWIRASSQEAAIIARCAGKTDIHNLEPEDMRSISIATSEALGLPLTSGAVRRERF
ncbi:MAG: glutamate synthase, partial [Desulfamplus sp.]|nr:glutamate synthase [Desulfamplus sp.]